MINVQSVCIIAYSFALIGCSEFDAASLFGQGRGEYKDSKTRQEDLHPSQASQNDFSDSKHAFVRGDSESPRLAAVRLSDRIDELSKVQIELQAQQRAFSAQLQSHQRGLDHRTLAVLREYGDYLGSLQELARMRDFLPNVAVWISIASMRSPVGNASEIEPFPLPPRGNESTFILSSDYANNLRKFFDLCLSRATGAELDILRSLGASMVDQNRTELNPEVLARMVTEMNSLLPVLNKAYQGMGHGNSTSLDVWVDTSQVQSRKDRKKLKRLFFEERKKREHSSPALVSMQGDIPSLYSLTVHRHSRHNRLRVFRNLRLHKVKIVGVCEAGKDPYMFSFECDDSIRSMLLLGDTRRQNNVADAVLKITCHDKGIAKRLVNDPLARTDRCFLSKWSNIAATEAIDHKVGLTDRKAKRAFRQLKTGEGCFAKDEFDIEIDCL
jgi:hypothetical protein